MMSLVNAIFNRNPRRFRLLPDSLYLRIRYYVEIGQKLNLKKPVTFNEKLQWLKLHDRRPEYSLMVDKENVKKYVAGRIGEQYIIPTIGVWDSFSDIDFELLPDQFVLKCTHDSGGLVLCRDKQTLNMKETEAKIQLSKGINYFYSGREWPYKNVKPRIIAEKYMGDNIKDYKLFCFNGKVKIILVCSDRFEDDGLKEDFFDVDWNHLDIQRPKHQNASRIIEKPYHLKLMIELAEKLAATIPFVRIDFYEIDKQAYFGEITFFPASGFEGFDPPIWDEKLGAMIQLPE